MRISNRILFFFTAVMLQQAPAGVAAQAGQPDPWIVKTAETYRQAVLAGDVTATADTYHEDAIEMAPGRPPLKGRAAIEQYYRELFQGPLRIVAFSFSYLEAVAIGDNGYVTGTYQQTLTGGPAGSIEDSGKFVAIIKRAGGTWRSSYVIYNSDRSQATPCPAFSVVPFPQHDLAILISHYLDAAHRWLFRLGMMALVLILLLSTLLLAKLQLPRSISRPMHSVTLTGGIR